jgi:hypothetical protein
MQRPDTSETVIEDDEIWIDDDSLTEGIVTPHTCYSSDSSLPIKSTDNVGLVSHIEESWKPGQVCADIQIHSKDTYEQEILILDQSDQSFTIRLKAGVKYAFVLVDGAIRVYITHKVHHSAIATDIGPSNITKDGGFILSGVIELSRQEEHPIRIPDDELRELNHILVAVCVR